MSLLALARRSACASRWDARRRGSPAKMAPIRSSEVWYCGCSLAHSRGDVGPHRPVAARGVGDVRAGQQPRQRREHVHASLAKSVLGLRPPENPRPDDEVGLVAASGSSTLGQLGRVPLPVGVERDDEAGAVLAGELVANPQRHAVAAVALEPGDVRRPRPARLRSCRPCCRRRPRAARSPVRRPAVGMRVQHAPDDASSLRAAITTATGGSARSGSCARNAAIASARVLATCPARRRAARSPGSARGVTSCARSWSTAGGSVGVRRRSGSLRPPCARRPAAPPPPLPRSERTARRRRSARRRPRPPVAAARARLPRARRRCRCSAPAGPTYDPWAWIIWGREIAHLDLVTTAGPSWKPLPVLFTTPFSLFGDAAAPLLWLLVARAGGLLAIAMAYRLAAAPRRDRAAGHDRRRRARPRRRVRRNFARGNSEGLLVAASLWAIERHLDGRPPRRVPASAVAAALLRPEVWPFVALYGVWLVHREWRQPRLGGGTWRWSPGRRRSSPCCGSCRSTSARATSCAPRHAPASPSPDSPAQAANPFLAVFDNVGHRAL